MEYIKHQKVILRVRNSLVARCPQSDQSVPVSSIKGRISKKHVEAQGEKEEEVAALAAFSGCPSGQVEHLNFIP